MISRIRGRKVLTYGDLAVAGACSSGLRTFQTLFGDGGYITYLKCYKALKEFHWFDNIDWAVGKFCSHNGYYYWVKHRRHLKRRFMNAYYLWRAWRMD